jgi:hypothetical protein
LRAQASQKTRRPGAGYFDSEFGPVESRDARRKAQQSVQERKNGLIRLQSETKEEQEQTLMTTARREKKEQQH